ncbi:flippase-like domain-containing protein [Spiractinospora alimapuensis]|nr:lysylphosphatidylglycerol synthase domain-containing protein [Spiractinospora alimapuensis]QVQ54863.1 flippase-like domain-containing protein [Spiractinospora alimapuensis]
MLRRLRSSIWLRYALALVAVGCAGWAIWARWDEVSDALHTFPLWVLPVSLFAAMLGLAAQCLAWRALLAGLGYPLPLSAAGHVFFVAQLGKYVPGSVWAFAAQVELARDYHVPRGRGTAATLLAVVVTLVVNLAVAAVTLPFVSVEAARQWWWALAAAPVLLVLLHPRILNRWNRWTPLAPRGMGLAVGLSLLAWIPLGAHIAVLAIGAGVDPARALPIAAGSYALAWTLGVALVVVPAGIGVREAVIVLGLSPVLDPGAALVVAALSRLVTAVADVAWAGIAAAARRVHPHSTQH